MRGYLNSNVLRSLRYQSSYSRGHRRGNWQEDDPMMKDHKDGDGERDGDRRGITLIAVVHEMMIIRNMQVLCH